MPSIRERISQAAQALFGRESRNMPMPMESAYHYNGVPPVFDPHASLNAYGDNPWLGGAFDGIAREIARTKFHLQTKNHDGEIEIIKDHESLLTLRRPQPTKGGKSLLSGMQLRLVTGYHLCLAG